MQREAAVVHPKSNRHELEQAPAPSKASIAGHPIHPMLIPFPVAFLCMVPVTDVVYAVTGETFWTSVSYYLLWAGLVGAGVAGLVGLVDFLSIERARTLRAGWTHVLLNLVIIALGTANLIMRWGDTLEQVLPSGLILSIVGALLLVVSGWYGGELAYRHKIGVIADG